MKDQHGRPVFEFSRRVELARLGTRATSVSIDAGESERLALARRFGLAALDRLEAELQLTRIAGGFVRLTGSLSADVVQTCVVSLEPVSSRVDEKFSLLYGPAESSSRIVLDLDSEMVEPLEGDAIDVGEAVAQQMALALDPYPRAPGATLAGNSGL